MEYLDAIREFLNLGEKANEVFDSIYKHAFDEGYNEGLRDLQHEMDRLRKSTR